MAEKRTRKPEGDIKIDLGFGDLFKGLGSFLDVVSELVDKAEQVQEKTGEFTAGKTASGEPIRGVYGFTIRTMSGSGSPKVESFGNIRETDKGPVVDETREPIVDIFDEPDTVLVVVELPGVAESEIELAVEDDILSLKTTGQRRYAKEILLPAPVDAASVSHAYKNGILEVKAKKVTR
jgi:HSP20 family protein